MAERLKVFVIHGRGATPRHPQVREEGGDLDCISSNVFYSAWARATNSPYELAFVQYHDGLRRTLEEFENADIYIPDLPIDTVPDFDGDLRALAARGSRVVQYLDHHPWMDWQIDMFNRLKKEGLLGEYAMSGARKGEMMPKDGQVCGAELVYHHVIEDQPWDSEGMEELRRLTRSQDLHVEEIPMAINLSKLIGTGFPKHEMVQALAAIKTKADIERTYYDRGWYKIVEANDRRLAPVLARIKRAVCEIRFQTKDVDHTWSIICALVPPKKHQNEPTPNVAMAMGYVHELLPRADYFFYCFGSRMLSTRKMTHEPAVINLGWLIEHLCAPRDGGHPEAASGRPQGNPIFPRQRLSYITEHNFIWYCWYLAKRLSEITGARIQSVKPVRFARG